MTVKVSDPKRPLNPAKEISSFEDVCNRICPYVLFAFLLVLFALVLFGLLRYNVNLTGTEANAFYYHLGDL